MNKPTETTFIPEGNGVIKDSFDYYLEMLDIMHS